MKHTTKEIKLQIGADKTNILSPHQRQFNNLTKKIEALTKKIEKDKVLLDNCLQEYSKKLPSLQEEYAMAQFEMAKTLAASAEQIKYSNKQFHDLSDTILELCNDAFCSIIATDEMKAFYNQWSNTSYEEEEEEQNTQIKQALSEELKNNLGVDIDFSDIDDTPEGLAKLQQRIMEAMNNKQTDNNESVNSPKKKKTKKQQEKEAIEKEEEDSKLKSIRSIYVALAKVLHPDTVTEEAEKLIREELMKKVTIAYNNKDIATLLRLELEWVANETNNLENLSEDKLKVYIATLKQQVKELEIESIQIQQHPRFHVISEFIRYNLPGALGKIKSRELALKRSIGTLKNKYTEIQKNYNKIAILKFVEEAKRLNSMEDIFADLFGSF